MAMTEIIGTGLGLFYLAKINKNQRLSAGFDELKITDLISFLVGYLPLTNLG
jgi:uncharacterized membrane protein YdcZ (DUF606 family)